MIKTKYTRYVCVYFTDRKTGETLARFVTGVDKNTATWEAGKPAMEFSESFADDIVYGLTFNGYSAGTLKVLKGLSFSNPVPKEDKEA